MARRAISAQTRNNWLMGALVALSATLASLSGVYFLYLPSNGYQGGRNPYHNLTVLFSRETWDLIHTWGGVIMIAAVLVHLALHWKWVAGMSKKVARAVTGRGSGLNRNGTINVVVDLAVAATFLLTAVSGIYFLFLPGGRDAVDPGILFTRTGWDMIHTWGGVLMIITGIAHLAIHWRWVTKVARHLISAGGTPRASEYNNTAKA